MFVLADALTVRVYRLSKQLPATERSELSAQLRRAALSVPSNIVEGTARRSTREYVNFLNVATASAAEAQYLVGIAVRLEMLAVREADEVLRGYDELLRGLKAMMRALENAN